MDLTFLPDSASYSTWLLGQSAVVVVLMLWIASLHLSLRREKRERMASQRRSDELSDRLVEVLLEDSRQRSDERDEIAASALEAFETALHGPAKKSGGGSRKGEKERER